MLLSFLFGGRQKNGDEEEKREEELEEPNLYDLIEKLLIEKQELQEKLTQMGESIELLQEKVRRLKEEKEKNTD